MQPSTFAQPGITRSAGMQVPQGYGAVFRRTLLGSGDEVRDRARAVILSWGVKTRAGFRVTPATGVGQAGDEFVIRLGPVREPVVVSWTDAAGFGYATLPGHPLIGEEAFLIEQDSTGQVFFVNRSVSRPATRGWLLATPLLRLAQAFFVRRYSRVLRAAVRHP